MPSREARPDAGRLWLTALIVTFGSRKLAWQSDTHLKGGAVAPAFWAADELQAASSDLRAERPRLSSTFFGIAEIDDWGVSYSTSTIYCTASRGLVVIESSSL